MQPNPTMSESAKYKWMFVDHLQGCGVDIGSQGSTVIPTAMGLDLPQEEFIRYNGGHPPRGSIQLRGYGDKLPFDDNSLDYVFSSHVLEDYQFWGPVLIEWVRVLKKPGGKLVILIPDKKRWADAMARGQCGNPAHKHEGYPGELSTYADKLGLKVLCDCLADPKGIDYNILFIAETIVDQTVQNG